MKRSRSFSTWQLKLLATSFCCPIVIMVFSCLDLLLPLSHINYDLFMNLRAASYTRTPKVLLLETQEKMNWQTHDLTELRNTLTETLGAKGVLFYGVEEQSRQEALPETESGVFRSYPVWISGGKQQAIEASLLSESEKSFPNNVLVDFGLGLNGVPKTSLKALRQGELIQELVQDRYVLVGEGLGNEVGLSTPVSRQADMSLLEFRGHALHTLVEGSWIREFDAIPTMLLLLLITLVSVPLYLRLTNKLSTIITAVFFVSYWCISAILFSFFSYSFPLVEMVLTQVLLFAIITGAKSIEAFKVLERLQLQSEAKLEQHYWPKALVASPDFWAQIAKLFTLVLPVTRCLFYVPQKRNGLFELASTVEQSLHGIPSELDPGYGRFNELLKVDQGIQPSDSETEKGEQTSMYVAPIQFAGKTVGLVLIEPDADTTVSEQVFHSALRQLAEEVAPLIHRRERTHSSTAAVASSWSLFSSSPELKLYHEIAHTFDESLLRIDKLENLLEGLGTAAIVYDLFGRVLFVNEHMRELTDEEELSLFDIEASEFISTLGQLSHEQTSSMIRSVIFQGENAYLPVRLKGRENSRFTMRIGPLELPQKDSLAVEKIEERGLVCEIADISAYSQLSELKGLLSQRLGLQIRNDLGVIEMGASILGDANVSEAERSELLGSVTRKVESITNTLADCEKYLAMDSEMQNREQYPVDSRSHLGKALNEVKELAHERGIELRVTQPNVMSYSVASAEGLEEVFVALLEVLIGDATDNGVVNTEIVETEDAIVHRLSNSGFGIPAERLKEYVFGSSPITTREFQRLRSAAEKVKSWGGTFEADSELGTGLRLSLQLPRFL